MPTHLLEGEVDGVEDVDVDASVDLLLLGGGLGELGVGVLEGLLDLSEVEVLEGDGLGAGHGGGRVLLDDEEAAGDEELAGGRGSVSVDGHDAGLELSDGGGVVGEDAHVTLGGGEHDLVHRSVVADDSAGAGESQVQETLLSSRRLRKERAGGPDSTERAKHLLCG